MNAYRTPYRRAMARAASNAGVWFDAKRVENPVSAVNYLRRAYPTFDWSYWVKPNEKMVTCRYIHRPEQV